MSQRFLVVAVAAFLTLPLVSSAEEPARRGEGRREFTPGSVQMPVIVDGVKYQPSEMKQFEGQPLYYLVNQASQQAGMILAFTSPESRREYVEANPSKRTEQRPGVPAIAAVCADARFNKVAYGTGTDWLLVGCGQTVSSLYNVSGDWNNRISYVEASGSWTYVYTCENFVTTGSCDEWAISGGTTIYDLNPYGFNNRISSIKVCPLDITFTECESF
ncbi:MAG: hypothetical protein QOH06_4532 [Acidobacteriota bacterium]|jgi:hypothetical protein|nr:hypothetical protein [Acidobacteriota bacterium]